MASYHPHPHPTSATTTTTAATCYCFHPYPNHPPCHHPPPPDPHLHHHHHHISLTPQTHQCHQIHQSHPNSHHFQQTPHSHQQQQTDQHLQPIISSLLRRIAALESSLKLYSTSASYSLRDAAARAIQTHFRAFLLRRSRTLGELKHLASIKSTLNALQSSLYKDSHIHYKALYAKATNLLLRLDSIQGGDPMIRDGKRSISRELNQFFKVVDGSSLKKSEVSRKIVKNMRCGGNNSKPRVVYSDKRGGNGETVKRRGDVTVKMMEQIRRIDELDMADESDGEEYDELDRLHTLLARKKGVSVGRTGGTKLDDGSWAKVKKSVHFADNNAYRVIRSRNEPVLIGECDSGDDNDTNDDDDDDGNSGDADQVFIIDNHRRETQQNGVLSHEKEDDEEEAQTEDEGSPPSSNGGSDVTFSSRDRNEVRRTSYDQSEDGSFTFSAPLPVLMEPRGGLMSRTKLVK